MKAIRTLLLALSILMLAWPCLAAEDDLLQAVSQAVAQAKEKLGGLDDPASAACLSNAGYALYQGKSTRQLCDVIPRLTAISLGRGNLLLRPCRAQEPLFLMFIKKQAPDKLLMSYWLNQGASPQVSAPLDIMLKRGGSFAPSKKALGDMAFNLVTLANGWAMGLPEDLMRGALNHGHLCCGVFTGYFTARFIEKRLPLAEGERYVYIGAPAWCQDDYITDYLRVTPGTSGYLAMAYPWSRAWRTKEKTYDKLGGVILRWNPKTQKGDACALRFDWRPDEFRRSLGLGEAKLDWQGQPWLHQAYNKFFMKRLAETEKFVSIWRQIKLDGADQYARLVNLGANPLAAILGPDPGYNPNAPQKATP